MVIHHHYISRRRFLARLEQKTLVVERALHAPAQIGLGRHFIPHLRARRCRQVGQRSILRFLRPLGDLLDIARPTIVEQRRSCSARLLEAHQAQIIPPALQQREAHLLIGERPLQERQILGDQLLLQGDRIRRHDRAFTVGGGPAECGHEIAQRLANAGACLEQRHAAAIERFGDRSRHRALAGPILVITGPAHALHRLRHQSVRPERDIDVVERHRLHLLRARHLGHDIHAGGLVIHDREAHAVAVDARRDFKVGVAGLE